MPELVVTCDIAAPAEAVWAAMVDWDRHSEWMLATRMSAADADLGVGAQLAARTGVGPVAFVDTMIVTQWSPPHRCVVEHTGRVVRGAGAFEVAELSPHSCRVTWSEWVEVPFGPVGLLAWPLVRPAAALFLRRSLERLGRLVAEAS